METTTELVVNGNHIVTVPAPAFWSREQVDLIKQTVAKGCSDDELALFLYVCKRTGLDPLARQIYAVKRGGRMTIQTGIDGYRLTAARTGEHAGTDDAQYDTEEKDHPNKATVTVYRFVKGQRCAFTASARWAEYYVRDGGFWERMPYLMLAKVSEALALRKAFPAELSGVYTDTEMAQSDNPTTETFADDGRADPRQVISQKQLGLLMACAKTFGVTEETLKAHVLEAYGVESRKAIPAEKMDELLTWIKQQRTDLQLRENFNEVKGKRTDEVAA